MSIHRAELVATHRRVRAIYDLSKDSKIIYRMATDLYDSLIPPEEMRLCNDELRIPASYLLKSEFALLATRRQMWRFKDRHNNYVYSSGGTTTKTYVAYDIQNETVYLAPKSTVEQAPDIYLTPDLTSILGLASPDHLAQIGFSYLKEIVDAK